MYWPPQVSPRQAEHAVDAAVDTIRVSQVRCEKTYRFIICIYYYVISLPYVVSLPTTYLVPCLGSTAVPSNWRNSRQSLAAFTCDSVENKSCSGGGCGCGCDGCACGGCDDGSGGNGDDGDHPQSAWTVKGGGDSESEQCAHAICMDSEHTQ